MKNKYNTNDLGIDKAFTVELNKIVEEKESTFYGRELVPFTDGSSLNIKIGDKIIEWKRLKTIGKAEILEERDDDIPFMYSAGDTQVAKTHWLRTGIKISVDERDKFQSINGEYEVKKLNSQIRTSVEVIRKRENDALIFGYEPLGRIGLMNVPGKRKLITGINMATATSNDILNMYISAAEEFENGLTEEFQARTLVVDRSIWAKLQEAFNSSLGNADSILKKISERQLFQFIKPIKGLINPTTGKPTQFILDDIEENYQAIDIRQIGIEGWSLARTDYFAVEEKISEILPFKPESIMEIETL